MIADAGTSRRWTGRARALPRATFGTTSTAAPRTALHLGGPGSCDGEHASKGRAQHGAVTKQRNKVCNADRCSPAVAAGITARWGAHSPNGPHAARGGTGGGTDLRMGMPSALMITYPMNPGYEPSFFMVSSTSDCRGCATSVEQARAGSTREQAGLTHAHVDGTHHLSRHLSASSWCAALAKAPSAKPFLQTTPAEKEKTSGGWTSKFVTHSCPSTQFASVLAGGGCRHAPAPCGGRTQPHGPTISL